MTRHPWSIRLLRLLLRTYPREFRERFGADLEGDFSELMSTRGPAAAWKYALSDLRRAVPMTHSDDQRARQRRYVDHARRREPHGLVAVRSTPRGPRADLVAGLHGRDGAHAGARHRRQQRHLQPRQRRAAAAARLPGARAADDDPRDHPGVARAALRRVAGGLLDLDQYQGSFTDIGVYRTRTMELSGSGTPESISVGADVRRGVPAARRRRRRRPHVPA